MEPWFIKNTAFSRRMDQKDLELFLRVCPARSYRKGEVIFRAGDPADNLHIIVEGQVKLAMPTAKGNERILAICGPDDFIGLAVMSEVNRYPVDAVALDDVVSCPISREQFMELMLKVPNAVLILAQILAMRLFHCWEQLTSTYDPVRVRVMKTLVEQARRFGKPAGGGWFELHTELKHEDIASLVTATRVSVSVTISELRERGLLEGTRGRYRLNVPALESLVET